MSHEDAHVGRIMKIQQGFSVNAYTLETIFVFQYFCHITDISKVNATGSNLNTNTHTF